MKTHGLTPADEAELERAAETSSPPPLLLTIPEAAAMLRLSRSKVYAMAARGELPTVRFGAAVRIHRPALERMIEGLVERAVRRER